MAVDLQRNHSCIYVICNYLKSPVPRTISIIGQQLDMIFNIILECPEECIAFTSAAHFIFRFVWGHFTTRLLFISKQHRWDTSQKFPSKYQLKFYFTSMAPITLFRRCFRCGLTARWRLVVMVSNQASLATLLSWMLDVLIKQKLRHMPEAATQRDIATRRVHARRAALQQDSRLKWNTEVFLKYLSTGSNILHLSLIFFFITLREEFCTYSNCSGNGKYRNLHTSKRRGYYFRNTNYNWLC
jgi:hypothetical protein